MTKQEWAVLGELLANFYPHSFKMESVDQVKAWFLALADLPGERVRAAILHMVRTQPAFPSIADIRKHAEADPLSAATAWSEVMKAVGAVGYMGTPEFSDPRIAKAVDALGGWLAVCEAPRKDHPTMRAQFRMAFEGETEVFKRRQTFEMLGVPVTPPALATPESLKSLLPPSPERKTP